jgi:hypothetical protein
MRQQVVQTAAKAPVYQAPATMAASSDLVARLSAGLIAQHNFGPVT